MASVPSLPCPTDAYLALTANTSRRLVVLDHWKGQGIGQQLWVCKMPPVPALSPTSWPRKRAPMRALCAHNLHTTDP